jgi:hypothetical protein
MLNLIIKGFIVKHNRTLWLHQYFRFIIENAHITDIKCFSRILPASGVYSKLLKVLYLETQCTKIIFVWDENNKFIIGNNLWFYYVSFWCILGVLHVLLSFSVFMCWFTVVDQQSRNTEHHYSSHQLLRNTILKWAVPVTHELHPEYI